MVFRNATFEDVPEINRLVNSAYRGESSKKGWTTEADLLDGLRTDESLLEEMIGTPDSLIVLGFEKNKLLACMYLRRTDEETCYLGMLTVEPSSQGAGIGSLLLTKAEEMAMMWGCTQMRMTVIHKREELLAYYERKGYKKTGKWEPFHFDKRYGVPKEELRLLELVKSVNHQGTRTR